MSDTVRVGVFAICLNVFVVVLKAVASYMSGLVILIGGMAAQKLPDEKHMNGHGRYEYISCMLVSILIMVAGLLFVMNGMSWDLISRSMSFDSPAVITILVISIILKLSAAILFGFVVFKNCLSAKTVSYDCAVDAIATLGILICGLLYAFSDINVDGYAAAFIGVLMIIGGLTLFKESVDLIVDSTDIVELSQLRKTAESVQGVVSAKDMRICNYGKNMKFASLTVLLPNDMRFKAAHDTADEVERRLSDAGFAATVHFEPSEQED